MKCKPSLSTSQWIIRILLLFGILAAALGIHSANTTTARFQRAGEQLFMEEMLANTLNMHYTIAHPNNYGIKNYEAILPAYSKENRTQSTTALVNQLAFYQGLDSSKLSDEDAYTLQLLIPYLKNTQALNRYPYYEEPLSPSSGMQSQLPILLAEYTFRCKRDVEDYLNLLDQTDEYFAGLLTFEQEKATEGLLMPAVSMKKVIEQCGAILCADDLEEGTHFLQTTFKERLLPLLQQGLLTEQDAAYYLQQNERLLSTVMLPAYEALGAGLSKLRDETIPLKGLASKPAGKEYYEQLLIAETGSYRPMDEIRQMLTEQLDNEFNQLVSLLVQYDADELDHLQNTLVTDFPYSEASVILKDLASRMEQDFPTLQAADSSAPIVTVKNVSKSLEEYCAPAFYLTPPLDDTNSNVIYVNQENSPCGVELYTTLAHEGYPGHLYQSVYSNNLLSGQDCGPLRQLLWYGGYLEGWAVYVEFLSYDYASDLMKQRGASDLAEYIQIEKHNRSLQLCLYSLLDLMIHYENASYSQVHKTLANFGISSPESTAAIYEYIVEEPANYPKYYLGYLEILTLQEKARTLWGEQYSDYAFHEFFLTYGPADFATLNAQLTESSVHFCRN